MRHEDHGGVDGLELALEPLEVLDVEMVRRLVEEEQIGAPREGAGERCAGQLAARERAERTIEVVLDEPEAAHRGRRAIAPPPASRMLEARLRLGVAAERRVVVGTLGHRGLQAPKLVFDVEQVARAGERVVAERDVELERRALIVERDARPFRERQLPALNGGLADDRSQERRLAGPVRAGEREPILAPDRERDVLEQRIACELLPQLRCDEDGHDGRRVVRGRERDVRDVSRSELCSL